MIQLYNTESRKKEQIVPLDGKTIRMYTCGPTVYNYAHIGNFRTYVFEDLLRRTLKFCGYQVCQAMNITDLDDKTIRGSMEKKISLKAFTAPYTEAFFEDLATLSIERVEYYPKATDYIPEMIVIIEKLMEKGIAYRGEEGNIYFAIDRFPSYGRLSHMHLCDLKVGGSERVSADEYDKENASDFVLWKLCDPSRDGDIYWESPFGKGRPGWHIECSAMAMNLLGASIDIHVGGVDNLFPHHENEIAQSEAYSSCHFVNHWLHAEHLLVDHKKMSKSLGNFYTLRDLLKKGYTGPQVRYMLLHTHYRTQLNFTFEGLDGIVSSLQRLSDFIFRLKSLVQQPIESKENVTALLERAMQSFTSYLADDLNISPALAEIFDLVREIHALADQEKIGKRQAEEVLAFLHKIDQVLAFLPLQEEEEAPAELQEILAQRESAREEKNWAAADACRDAIHAKGYVIEDTPQGARLKKRKP